MKILVLLALLGACQPGSNLPQVSERPRNAHELGLCWGIIPDGAVLSTIRHKGCLEPQAVQFATTPIRVVAPLGLYSITDEAARAWNTDVGFELFSAHVTTDTEAEPFDVYVLDYSTRVAIFGQLADARFHTKLFDGRRVRPSIKIDSPQPFAKGGKDYVGQIRVWFGGDSANVLAHELGHIVGLAHDSLNKRSIMYPNSGWVMPVVEPADKAILRARYL